MAPPPFLHRNLPLPLVSLTKAPRPPFRPFHNALHDLPPFLARLRLRLASHSLSMYPSRRHRRALRCCALIQRTPVHLLAGSLPHTRGRCQRSVGLSEVGDSGHVTVVQAMRRKAIGSITPTRSSRSLASDRFASTIERAHLCLTRCSRRLRTLALAQTGTSTACGRRDNAL